MPVGDLKADHGTAQELVWDARQRRAQQEREAREASARFLHDFYSRMLHNTVSPPKKIPHVGKPPGWKFWRRR